MVSFELGGGVGRASGCGFAGEEHSGRGSHFGKVKMAKP